LLALSRAVLAELKARGVIRSGNAPAGDYAELLVRQATSGELAPNSQKSWDVVTPDMEPFQVKARVVTNPQNRGERQLSVFRSWEFDAAVIVLFDDRFGVWRASCVPADAVRSNATSNPYVGGWRVFATDMLLEQVDDWTERLRAATA
jgi:hypothetical protein